MRKKFIYIDEAYGWRKTCYKNETLWIKGIIYNYNDISILHKLSKIKSNLIKKFINSIDGHFAIIFESRNKILSFVDQISSIPIFYYFKDQKFLISAYPSMISNRFKKSLNNNQVLSMSMASYTIGDETIYKNLFSIKAGTFVVYTKKTNLFNKKDYHKYDCWKISKEQNFLKKKKQLSKLNISVIKKIYNYSLKKNKSIAIPLSAGFDSRFVASTLKTLGAKNVFCFSYGYKDNFESKASKKIAKKLDFDWQFIELDNQKIYEMYRSKKFKKFRKVFDTFNCVSDLTEFYAINELYKNKKLINCIIVNGNSGDFITGGHILEYKIFKNLDKTYESLISVFLNKHFRLWQFLANNKNDQIINKLLKKEIKNNINLKKITRDNSHSFIEYLEYYNRQAKHLSSKQRTYEFFNCEWALPMWDKDYIEFWRKINRESKLGQKLYFQTLINNNLSGIWEGKWITYKDIAKTTPILFRFFLRPIIKALFIFKGKSAWHLFEKKYLLYFTDILCGMGIKKYNDLIFDNRGFRNSLSFHTEDYLLNKKIEINKINLNIK